jgi:hypothetical protein
VAHVLAIDGHGREHVEMAAQAHASIGGDVTRQSPLRAWGASVLVLTAGIALWFALALASEMPGVAGTQPEAPLPGPPIERGITQR